MRALTTDERVALLREAVRRVLAARARTETAAEEYRDGTVDEATLAAAATRGSARSRLRRHVEQQQAQVGGRRIEHAHLDHVRAVDGNGVGSIRPHELVTASD